MLILSTEEARPGMALAAPVLHPDSPEQELLKRGYVLEESVLGRLSSLGVDTIYVDYPALDDLDKHLAVQLSPERQAIYQRIKQGVQTVQRQTRAQVSYTDYYSTTRDLICTLMSQGLHPLYLDQMSRAGGDVVSHASAVAHLSLVLGLKLENYLISQRKRLPPHHAKEVVNLGVAGMLHDIGTVQLSPAARDASGVNLPADPALLEEWLSHSRVGYEMVKGGIEASAASAILHHHQHFDGSGFPGITHRDGSESQLKGERIHIFARIVMLADLYDRLATSGPTRKRRSNLEVLHLMQTTYGGWCDPVVLKILGVVAPPFTPGSRVGLSDGTAAIVVDVDAARPYQPIVKRVIDDALTLAEEKLDLAAAGAPSIETISGCHVAEFLPGAKPATCAN